MGIVSDLFKAQVEELKRQDEENTREMLAIIDRCNIILKELSTLDNEGGQSVPLSLCLLNAPVTAAHKRLALDPGDRL